MKAWWDQLKPIELPPNIRRNAFRASFSKKLDLSGDDFEIAPNVYKQLASVLANVTELKELSLTDDPFALTKLLAIGHFNFQLANMKITYPYGVYVGEWKEGRKNGQGKMTYARGTVYEGEYKEGKMRGQGKWTNASGHVYVGEFKSGKMNGQGKQNKNC